MNHSGWIFQICPKFIQLGRGNDSSVMNSWGPAVYDAVWEGQGRHTALGEEDCGPRLGCPAADNLGTDNERPGKRKAGHLDCGSRVGHEHWPEEQLPAA